MLHSEVCLDAFVQFLVEHADDVVGHSGLTFFRNPLAEWLTASCGCLVVVDGTTYSQLSSCQSFVLPRWGRLLVSWMERCPSAPLTGETVFRMLAHIEEGSLAS